MPRTLLCLAGAGAAVVVVAGYKKFYESLELSLGPALSASASASASGAAQTASSSRILDVEKEHRMVALEVSINTS